MPMITVQYATPRTTTANSGLTPAIAAAVSKLSSEILKKDPNVTAINVEEGNPATWFIAGKTLVQHRQAAFWVDVRVTDGTNTREEKAFFVAAMFAAMQDLLGPLHNECYVYVDEVRGDAYGYGGLTQNERYFAGKPRADIKSVA